MHELTIVDSLLAAALDEAGRHGATAITRIKCRIGRLRQIDQQLLREAFEVVRCGSLARHALLEVTYESVRLACRQCSQRIELEEWRFECPGCGSSDIELTGGDQIELTSLELEVPDGDCRPAQERV